jgi:hypothetical protein
MKEYLSPSADIVCSPDFENGVLKILNDEVLNPDEAKVCTKLLRKTDVTDSTTKGDNKSPHGMSTLEKVTLQVEFFAKKQKKSHKIASNTLYVDVGLLIRPTSNSCERTFSVWVHHACSSS